MTDFEIPPEFQVSTYTLEHIRDQHLGTWSHLSFKFHLQYFVPR